MAVDDSLCGLADAGDLRPITAKCCPEKVAAALLRDARWAGYYEVVHNCKVEHMSPSKQSMGVALLPDVLLLSP